LNGIVANFREAEHPLDLCNERRQLLSEIRVLITGVDEMQKLFPN